MKLPEIYDAAGAARFLDKSESWGRQAFRTGVVPTELLINGKRPAVTSVTLQKLSATLRSKRKSKR